MIAPVAVINVIAALDRQSQDVLRGYLEELEGRWRLAVSRELDARGKVTRLRDSIQDVIQNTRGLPPDCRVKLLDSLGELVRQ